MSFDYYDDLYLEEYWECPDSDEEDYFNDDVGWRRRYNDIESYPAHQNHFFFNSSEWTRPGEPPYWMGSLSTLDESYSEYSFPCSSDDTLDNSISLKELCCKVIGQNLPFEAVDRVRSKIPDDAVLSIFRYSLPLEPKAMDFLRDVVVIKRNFDAFRFVRCVEQIGSVLSCQFHFSNDSDVITASLTADRGKITRAYCSACHKKWCQHVVNLISFHFLCPQKIKRYLPISDYLNEMNRNELQAVFQRSLLHHYDDRMLHSVMREIKALDRQGAVTSAIDPTLGGSFHNQAAWYLDSMAIKKYCDEAIEHFSGTEYFYSHCCFFLKFSGNSSIMDNSNLIFNSLFYSEPRVEAFQNLKEFFHRVVGMLDDDHTYNAFRFIKCISKTVIMTFYRTFDWTSNFEMFRPYPYSSFVDCMVLDVIFVLLFKAATKLSSLADFQEMYEGLGVFDCNQRIQHQLDLIFYLSRIPRTSVEFTVIDRQWLHVKESFSCKTYSFNDLIFTATAWKQLGWSASSNKLIENVAEALQEAYNDEVIHGILPHSIVYLLQNHPFAIPIKSLTNLVISSINSFVRNMDGVLDFMANPIITLCFWLLTKQCADGVFKYVKDFSHFHQRTQFLLDVISYLSNPSEQSHFNEHLFFHTKTTFNENFTFLFSRIAQYILLKFHYQNVALFVKKIYNVVQESLRFTFRHIEMRMEHLTCYILLMIAKSIIKERLFEISSTDVVLELCKLAWKESLSIRESDDEKAYLVHNIIDVCYVSGFTAQFFGHFNWVDLNSILSMFLVKELLWMTRDDCSHDLNDVVKFQKWMMLESITIKCLKESRYPLLWSGLDRCFGHLSELLRNVENNFADEPNAEVVHFIMLLLEHPEGSNQSSYILQNVTNILTWKWNKIPITFNNNIPQYFKQKYDAYRVPIILIFLVFKHYHFNVNNFHLSIRTFFRHCRRDKPHFRKAMKEVVRYIQEKENLTVREIVIRYPSLKKFIRKTTLYAH